eukprot:30980-Pelagococcus_subviridis.AAC.16
MLNRDFNSKHNRRRTRRKSFDCPGNPNVCVRTYTSGSPLVLALALASPPSAAKLPSTRSDLPRISPRRERGRLPAPARPRQQQRIRVPDGADVRVKLVDDVPSRNAPGAVLLHRDDVQVSLQLRGRPVGREIGHGERVHARLRPSLRRRRAADAPGMMRHRIPGVIEMPRPGP